MPAITELAAGVMQDGRIVAIAPGTFLKSPAGGEFSRDAT